MKENAVEYQNCKKKNVSYKMLLFGSILNCNSKNNNKKTTNSTQQRSNKIWLSITRELDKITFTYSLKLHRLF